METQFFREFQKLVEVTEVKSGTEHTSCKPDAEWKRIAQQLMLKFEESGFRVFRGPIVFFCPEDQRQEREEVKFGHISRRNFKQQSFSYVQ